MRQNINGFEFETNPAGVVLWSQDWISLFQLAHDGLFGLSLRRGGPGTYGHTDVIAGPWSHMADGGRVAYRLAVTA